MPSLPAPAVSRYCRQGGVVRPGPCPDPNSKRQQRLRAALANKGGVVGKPKAGASKAAATRTARHAPAAAVKASPAPASPPPPSVQGLQVATAEKLAKGFKAGTVSYPEAVSFVASLDRRSTKEHAIEVARKLNPKAKGLTTKDAALQAVHEAIVGRRFTEAEWGAFCACRQCDRKAAVHFRGGVVRKPGAARRREFADAPDARTPAGPRAAIVEARLDAQTADSGEVALAGADGANAERLLAGAKAEGVKVLGELARAAVKRLLASRPGPRALNARSLFSEEERARLAETLAATVATADLLGRSRVRLRLEAAERAREKGVRAFAEPTRWEAFADGPPKPLAPEAAVAYFRGLVPTLGVDPGQFGADVRRRAFTLAAATEEKLLGQVQQLIGEQLERGTVVPRVGKLEGGREISYVPHAKAEGDDVLVLADPRRLDTAWRKDRDYYIPPGGGGAEVAGRREDFQKFLRGKKPVEAPRLTLDPDGTVGFTDGRHRFSVLRDLGADRVAVMVPADQAAAFRAKFASAVVAPQDSLAGPKALDAILDHAGVTKRSGGYSEMVWRTNLRDSYLQGAQDELADPFVRETFPVYRYAAVSGSDGRGDGRNRPHHLARHGRYYPATVPFVEVRGAGIEDAANCRCDFIPVSRWDWAELYAAGARVAAPYPQIVPEAA